jgi:hypothetical protein
MDKQLSANTNEAARSRKAQALLTATADVGGKVEEARRRLAARWNVAEVCGTVLEGGRGAKGMRGSAIKTLVGLLVVLVRLKPASARPMTSTGRPANCDCAVRHKSASQSPPDGVTTTIRENDAVNTPSKGWTPIA